MKDCTGATMSAGHINMQDPQTVISGIEEMAIEAGNVILAIRSKGITRTDKQDGSPVTEADMAADQLIRDRLAQLAPGITAITEESWEAAEQQGEPEQYWCVDPLDGTKGFINGGSDFTVNIALIRNRCPRLGVIYAPALGCLWAADGKKAWRRSARPAADHSLASLGTATRILARPAKLEKPRVVATRAHRTAALEDWLQRIDPSEAVAVGSSLKFCTIAEGKADLYPRIGPTMEWDTAAGQSIVETAGGTMVSSGGAPFLYGKPGRLNGYFTVTAKLAGPVPVNWLPPLQE